MSDPRTDPATFDRHIRHISDEDLFASLGGRFGTYQEWSTHWAAVGSQRAKFTDREFFLGPRDDLPALYNAADALVLSSVVEGLPMVLLEAAATGLPCVATRAGGADEAVLDGHTGFLAPCSDPAALAAAMTCLMQLPADARAAMGRAARRGAHCR